MKIMETKSNSKSKALLALISLIGALVFLASVVLHIAPLNMLKSIIDFSSHHYFLMGFISLAVVVISIKLYNAIDLEFEKQFNNKNNPNYIINKQRRFSRIREQIYLQTNKFKSKHIDKEKIKKLKFPSNDVLIAEEDKTERNSNLLKAMMLGNSIKHKVKIYFKDINNYKHVETTVWYANSNHINLKGGVIIPVKSIYKVEI